MIRKTTRSILSVLLAALLLVTSTPLTPAFADGGAVSPQSANNESRELEQDGDGTYLIYTAENLKEFAVIVNGTDSISADSDADAKLMNDIDLSSVCSEENGTWTPIGNSEESAYIGTFNGNGKTISGLYIDSNDYYQGLFGRVGTGGTVKDLTVSGNVNGNRYVGGVVGYNSGSVENCYNTGSVKGSGNYVGGVVGLNDGTVENCYNIGEVSGNRYVGGIVGYNNGGTVENCYNTGTITGTDDYVVGVVGYNNGGTVKNCHNIGEVSGNRYVGGVVGSNNNGRVENCYNTGEVSGNSSVGGVVGSNISDGSVTNSYNTGAVSGGEDVGGVVGYNISSVTNCYNTGSVSGPDSGSSNRVGGVVGYNDGDRVGGRVENCYNIGEVSGNSSVGGVVGYNRYSASVTNCYFLKQDPEIPGIGNNEDAEGATAVDDLDELCKNFESVTGWETNTILNRPVLTSNHEDDGTQAHPYRISTATQLETFRNLVNNGIEKSAHAKLMNNIDLSSVCGENAGELGQSVSWTPIGNSIGNSYSGTFNGNGKTISGLYINNSTADYQGLFCYVGSSGKVQNLSVSGSVSGDRYVGGVVGLNRGTVENCYNTGSVSGPDSVNGETTVNVGGVVGYNISGSVENCYNTGSVSGSGNSVGGVVGENSGSVKNCYNTGSVSDGTYTGGVVGYNSGGSVTGCYFLQGTAESGIGKNEGSGDATATEKDDTAFHSGEVAWRLQAGQADGSSQVWGQNIKDGENDNYPQLRAFDADTPQVYKVAFMNDSEEHDAKYANSGMTVGSPTTNPTKEGHTFAGWKDENDSVPSFPITVSGNLTYYAQWTPHTYSITASPSTLDFGSITEGEERPAAQTVTVKNTGNQRVTLVQPTATNFEITTSDNLTLNAGAIATFTIQPKDNLPRGSYSEQIVVSNTNDEKATITATFTVKEPPYTGKYSYELTTSVGDHGSLTVDRYATEGDTVTIQVAPDQAYKLDDLSVTANGKDVELTANSDGTYTFTMPSADVRITATFAEDPDWTEPEEPATDVSDIFVDVAPNAWYKDAIQYAYDNGLMTGVSATEFAPEATTTRAMIVSILARLENVTTAEAAGFADVDDEWYATAVNWAASVGVVNGYEDNTFRPNTAITREQLAAILMNYAAYKGEDVSNRADLTSYTDQPSAWATETMSWAVAEGLISGVTNTELQPQSSATRAQVAAILQRFLEA